MDLQITVVEDDLELSEDELGQSQGITVDGPNLTFQNGNSCQLSNETFSKLSLNQSKTEKLGHCLFTKNFR